MALTKKRKKVTGRVHVVISNPEESAAGMKQGVLKESHKKDSPTEEDSQPQSSPYITPVFILSIGLSGMQYTVLEKFLCQCSEWMSLCQSNPLNRTIKLPELDEDIGHTLVHYLYTNTYQTLRLSGTSDNAKTVIEYKRSVLIYCAARRYGLDGLEVLAKDRIRSFDGRISIFDVLDVAKGAYPRLPHGEIWFPDYFKNKIKAAFEIDDTLFTKDHFLDRIGTVAAFDKAAVNSIVETYTEKIGRMVSKEEASCKGSSYNQVETEPCDELGYDAVPSEEPANESPAPDEASAATCNGSTYDAVPSGEPACEVPPDEPCDDISYEAIPCEAPSEEANAEPCDDISCEAIPCEAPPEGASADAYYEVTYNKVACEEIADCKGTAYDEPNVEGNNSVCIFQAKHLAHEEMWKNCQKCRAFLHRLSVKFAREGSFDEV
ncbi:MAG: hypothetical protein M1816_001852 [Peltula sp. TS41687]|nr:MAG: hypothetical protein M1816_001852 [Peltula sp. TS41687]